MTTSFLLIIKYSNPFEGLLPRFWRQTPNIIISNCTFDYFYRFFFFSSWCSVPRVRFRNGQRCGVLLSRVGEGHLQKWWKRRSSRAWHILRHIRFFFFLFKEHIQKVEDLNIYFLQTFHIIIYPLVHGKPSSISRGQVHLVRAQKLNNQTMNHLRTFFLDFGYTSTEITGCY